MQNLVKTNFVSAIRTLDHTTQVNNQAYYKAYSGISPATAFNNRVEQPKIEQNPVSNNF